MEAAPAQDQLYFDAYADASVHETMLRDKPRNDAYRQALEQLAPRLRGMTVMDVGAGTGLLSLFAARCGAKRVYAVEASALAPYTRLIVEHNGLQDVITVLHSRVEDVALPERVDVIVSEWMGFYLFHESMLASVLHARDHWLKPGGLLLPARASLWLCPVQMSQLVDDRLHFWENVEGFDMSAMLPLAVHRMLSRPEVCQLEPGCLLAAPQRIMDLDLYAVGQEDLVRLQADFSFEMTREGVAHGLATWFDVSFPVLRPGGAHAEAGGESAAHASTVDAESSDSAAVVLHTGPDAPPTHWKQVVVMLPETYAARPGTQLRGHMEFVQDPDAPRSYKMEAHVQDDDTVAEAAGEEDAEREEGDGNAALLQALMHAASQYYDEHGK